MKKIFTLFLTLLMLTFTVPANASNERQLKTSNQRYSYV